MHAFHNYHSDMHESSYMKTAYSPVISVQAVNQFRKDARLDEIVYRRVTVTGQQLPTNAVTKRAAAHTHAQHIN